MQDHYLKLAKFDFDNDQINLHPDYMGAGVYTLEYAKTAMVLFMLEYTVGDKLFSKAMLDYYDKWKFKHPDSEDFVRSVEATTNRELDWFFEQWLNTNRKLDYKVKDIDGEWKSIGSTEKYFCKIEFERMNKIFMPIDFDVYLKNGDTIKYQIPVDKFFKPEKNRLDLPYWHFSKKIYTAEIMSDSKVEKVVIDPSLRLMDINMLNNSSDCVPEQEFYFMKYTSNTSKLNKYMWEFWPTSFYNDIDKVKVGANLKGAYLDIDHKLDMWLWFKTAKGYLDFDFRLIEPQLIGWEN